MKILKEDNLEKNKAYMLRQDGRLFKCSDNLHPYMIDDIVEGVNDPYEALDTLMYSYPENVEWFYKNTKNEKTKRNIEQFWCFVKSHQGELDLDYKIDINIPCTDFSIIKNMNIEDFWELYFKINEDTNEEFCRVRMGGLYDSDSTTGSEIYFRIGSKKFNWFNTIWGLVHDYVNVISTVTVTYDGQSGRVGTQTGPLKRGGVSMDHLPVDEFITLHGNPDLSSYHRRIYNSKNNLFE